MNIHKRVSLVIPVYNEADQIRACLEAVARQTLPPYEVLVIDNNSTDDTAKIAASFPFVRLLYEEQQGVVHARDRGFNAAKGSIIARIDADTVIPNTWVATVAALFNDARLGAVTGSVQYRDITLPLTVSRIDLFWRRRMARLLGRDVALQGANMALRRTVWHAISEDVCHERGLHEDFDLAIHANQAGHEVRFDERLQASVCYRQADYDFRAFREYALISPRTYLRHGVRSGAKMYQVVIFVVALYPLISLMSRGYDEQLGRFSIAKLFLASLPPRVNPATYVD